MSAPRLGFLGVGWIGRNRMDALLTAGAEAIAVADPAPANLEEALKAAPGARPVDTLAAMLALDIDGVVIATPSALHAAQAIEALDGGKAVFCQKPLGRNSAEVEAVLAAARRADRLVAVDLSYRHLAAIQPVRQAIQQGELGSIYGVDLVFHNAYGPDKPWFYNPELSGGGCLIDLGIHLIDLALWVLDFPTVRRVSGRLLANGAALGDRTAQVEDYAVGEILLDSGVPIRIACSWGLAAGQEAVISAEFYGTTGGAAMKNVAGSFYDFAAWRYRGTAAEQLVRPPDPWGGRAAVAWARRLADDLSHDPGSEQLVETARLIDGFYAAADG